MLPIEMNVINQISGNDIYLARIEQIEDYGAIDDYIIERARKFENLTYYCATSAFEGSFYNFAQYKIKGLYHQGRLIQGALRVTSLLLKSIYNSLSWHLTNILQKLFASGEK